MASIEELLCDLDEVPPQQAITISKWGGGDGPSVILLDHSGAPYWREFDAVHMALDSRVRLLQGIAHDYIRDVVQPCFDGPFLGLDASWLFTLDPAQTGNDGFSFGWMPLDPRGEEETQMPLGSMDASMEEGDKLLVLFAAQRIGEHFLGSEFGLRMAVRWREKEAGGFLIWITGMSAALPFGAYDANPADAGALDVAQAWDYLRSVDEWDRRPAWAELAGLRGTSICIRGVRVARLADGEAVVERHCIGARPGVDGIERPHAVSILTKGKFPHTSIEWEYLQHQSALTADATGNAQVFVRTPGPERACRPRRDDVMLVGDRVDEPVIPGKANPPLEDSPYLQVIPCPRIVRDDIAAGTPLPVPLPGPGPEPRSNAASAIQPFWHGRDLLERMKAYGFKLDEYFQIITPTIDIAYRSGVSPGPGKDGRSVNARVQPLGWPPDFIGPVSKNEKPVVQLHLSVADQARRNRAKWEPGDLPTPAVPLGIGSDPRWMWHEFGHVLTLASTGELELRFAHSPGDALAAIVGDPQLSLKPEQAMWRGATFPWVFLARRHDRCVTHGWSWCGTMHRELAESPAILPPRPKGYKSEQILSTTLFRIYRCLGGDTNLAADLQQPDSAARLRASHYACFLIMQALRILGDSKTMPSYMPDQFVQALKDADRHLGTWKADYPPVDDPATQNYTRVGGCSTKIIRWAFEAQGLYGDTPGHDSNQPGQPERVDVYVKSRRPDWDDGMNGDAVYRAGSYVPVSLHWQSGNTQDVPRWQADPDEGIVWRPNDSQLDVKVGNRGTSPAMNVRVTVWAIPWPLAQVDPPDWKHDNSGGWQKLLPAPSAAQNIPAGQSVTFKDFAFQPTADRHIIVAIASCRADKPLLELPNHACSFTDTPLADLVAGDNNLGLLVIRSP